MGFSFQRLSFSGYSPRCKQRAQSAPVKHHATPRRTKYGSHPQTVPTHSAAAATGEIRVRIPTAPEGYPPIPRSDSPVKRGILKGEADCGDGPPFGASPLGGCPLKRPFGYFSHVGKVTPPAGRSPTTPPPGVQGPGAHRPTPHPAGVPPTPAGGSEGAPPHLFSPNSCNQPSNRI